MIFRHRLSRLVFIVAALASVTFAAACGAASTSTTSNAAPGTTAASTAIGPQDVSGELVIYSGRSEPLIQPVLDRFSVAYPGVRIVLKTGKNGELANALLEERANPQADLFITTELFTIQSLASEGVLQSYSSPRAVAIPAEFKGQGDLWTGLTRRARVIMYNTDLVPPDQVPQSIFDLTDEKWREKVAAADSTNGSMQAQIAVLRQLQGDSATEQWVKGLVDNNTTFFGGHTDVRKAVAAGEFALGLVNHYYYHLQKAEGGPVGVVYPDQADGQIGVIANATAVALINGAKNVPAAQALIDFLLSVEGQQLFAELNYEYPLIADAVLHKDVAPLTEFRLADVNVAAATQDLEGTFAIIERAGMK